MTDIVRSGVGARLAQVTEFQNILFLAGQVAQDVEKDITGQTQEVLEKIDHLLAEHGSDKSRLLQVTIYLNNMALADGMNKAWDQWIIPGCQPARATVEAQLATPKKLIEITVIAAKK